MKLTGIALILMGLFAITLANGDHHTLLNPKTGRLMAPTHHGTYLDPKTGRLMVPAHDGTYLDPKTGQLLAPANQGYQPEPNTAPVMAPKYDKNFLNSDTRETPDPAGVIYQE